LTPFGLSITGKEYVVPLLLAYILAILRDLKIFFIIPMPWSALRLHDRPPSPPSTSPTRELDFPNYKKALVQSAQYFFNIALD